MATALDSGSERTTAQALGNVQNQLREYRQRAKELKRNRGELSCFECRRLKIRCDKKVPCSTCLRRRCEDICPNGPSIRSPAEVDSSRIELGVAKERIRQLEEALRKAHSRLSDTTHTLLRDQDIPNVAQDTALLPDSDPDPIESFGTLTIADGGDARFLGHSAASETLIASDFQSSIRDDDPGSSDIPREALQASQMWPFTPAYLTKTDHQSLLEASLPTYQRASALCEAFLENLSWLHTPIKRPQVMEELLPAVYKRKRAPISGASFDRVEIHDLALILAVFACGAAGDLTQKPDNEEGRAYYTLARAALGLSTSRNSVSAIQALILLSLYLRFSWSGDDMEESWKILTTATGMGKSIGLYRDPGRWKLDPKMQERRRSVFWVLYLLDNYYALSSGRPPSFTSNSIDVLYAEETKTDADMDGTNNLNGLSYLPQLNATKLIFWAETYWKYEFLQRCLAPITQRLCADTRPIKYQEVFELDRKLSEFKAEEAAYRERTQQPGETFTIDPFPLKKRFLQLNCDTLRMGIHRNFFAKAILDYPEDPLKSPFAPSFLSTFHIATYLLKEAHGFSDYNMPVMLRIWPFWLHILVAGVVVGSVASRCPTSNLAPSAFASLEVAIHVYKKAPHHPIVANGLRILGRLRERASRAMFMGQQPSAGHVPDAASGDVKVEENGDDELAVLRGDSRLVSQEKSHSPSTSGANSRTTSSPAYGSPQPMHNYTPNTTPENITTTLFNAAPPQCNSQLEVIPIDWTAMDLDAFLSGVQAQEWFTSTAVGSVVDDGSFAILEPEVFMNQASNLDTLTNKLEEYGNTMWHEWNTS